MRKIYLLNGEDCTPCSELKEALKEEIASGKVQVLSLNSEDAQKLLKKAGSPDKLDLPSALVEDEKGVRYCQIFSAPGIVLSKCEDRIIAIREPEESTPPPSD